MRTKWIYTILVLALGFFTSCNNEVDEAAGNKKTRTVVFRLAVDDAVGSRAGWDTNDNPVVGTGIENRIDLKGIRVAIYSINDDGTVGSRVGVADNLLYWSINENSNANDPIEYQLVGDISDVALEDNKSYRFMVYANFPNITNNQFGLDEIGVEDGYIPMWGVATHTVSGAELEELGTIDLLRAAAKVEVTFNEANVLGKYNVTGLSIKNYNDTGNNLPTGWNNAASTKALDMENCINATGSHVHGSNLSFLTNIKDDKYYIYIPEYRNASHTAEEQSVVTVTLTDKTNSANSKTYEIPFCQYDNNSPIANSTYNIVRNHIYRFNVTGVKSGNLLLNFNVADWNDGASLALGSLAYPTYGNPVLPAKTHQYPEIPITDEPQMRYVSNGDSESFEMFFNFISTNSSNTTGFVWRPTIVNQQSTSYSIEVYKVKESNQEELVYKKLSTDNDPTVNKLTFDSRDSNADEKPWEGWFKIKVTPADNVVQNTIYTFGIACGVHPSGFPSEDFFLFINGENDEIAWPKSGIDRKFINITQIP